MDKLTREARSRNMARIRSKNTKPELLLRKRLHYQGFRYRVHYRVDGISVDIAFPSRRKAINVNGCFWHQHENCSEASKPKTNRKMWKEKLQNNRERDIRNMERLTSAGWDILVVWECELERNTDMIMAQAQSFIEDE